MMRFLQRLLAVIISVGIVSIASAQFQAQEHVAMSHLKAELADIGLSQSDINDLHLNDAYQDKRTGATYLYFVQQYQGVPIYNSVYNVTLTKDNEVVHRGNRLIADIADKASGSQPTLQPVEAIFAAANHFEVPNLAAKASPTLKEQKGNSDFVFEKGEISNSDIPVKLCYQLNKEGKLKLAWELSIDMKENSDYWSVRVDAEDGSIIDQNNFTVYCSFGTGPFLGRQACNHIHHKAEDDVLTTALSGGTYRVFELPAESPSHGPHNLVVAPADTVASPFGWHDTNGADGAEFTITRGNNVHAYLDLIGNNTSAGDEPDGGADLIFDYPYDPTFEPAELRETAVTNLFYMNNVMHDITYHYGFTEDAGNFQQTNYTGTGTPGDYVMAEAQDGSGQNNANFSTPADGGNGRMQMFLWNTGSNFLFIEGNDDITGWYTTGTADYGPVIDENTMISGEIVEGRDDFFNPSATDACEALTNGSEVEGKIALVDRGGCFFEQKTLNAEAAGAIAVIICNFAEDAIGLAGALPEEPTIPTISLGNSDCVLLRQFLSEGFTATIMPRPNVGPEEVDGDFDNGIVAHEYGHGISNRLTGGPRLAGCLGNAEQMGEGWSDFFSLITTAKLTDRETPRGIGTFAEKDTPEGRGIRPFPYSIDFDINPLTFQDASQLSVPHGLGSVWCTMLWDLYWAMADEFGFDDDVTNGTGGNNMAIALVMEGMRLQACSPGFVDGRDAILAADQLLFNGDNQCLIWNTFARRGLGFNATQGDNNIIGDNVEDFETMPSCIRELRIAKSATPVANAGDEITMSITVTNFREDALNGVVVTDELPEGLTFSGVESIVGIDESLITVNTANTGMVVFDFNDETLASGQEVVITYTANTDPSQYSVRMFYEPIADNSNATFDKWLLEILSDPDESPNIWNISNEDSNGDGWSWRVDDAVTDTRQLLQTFEPLNISGTQPVLRFFHRFDTYPGQHGGVVEVSRDGVRFDNNPDAFIRNGYSGLLAFQAFVEPQLFAFTGQSGSEFEASYLDLSEYLGDDVNFRFRFGTRDITEIPGTAYNTFFNNANGGDGWFVDDFEVLDLFNYNGEVCITTSDGQNVCTTAPEAGTIIESQNTSSVETLEDGSEIAVYPNPASDILHLSFDSKVSRDIDVSILTIDGKAVQSQSLRIFEGNQVLNLNVSDLSAGLYFVTIQSEDNLITQKVIIE